MGFPRQEYWNGLPFPSPGDFPNPGIQPRSPALASRFFCTEPPGKSHIYLYNYQHTQDTELFHHSQAGFFSPSCKVSSQSQQPLSKVGYVGAHFSCRKRKRESPFCSYLSRTRDLTALVLELWYLGSAWALIPGSALVGRVNTYSPGVWHLGSSCRHCLSLPCYCSFAIQSMGNGLAT